MSMNYPDFSCSIEDNRGILIVIHALNPCKLDADQWRTVVESVCLIRQLCFENTPREINFRYQVRNSLVKPGASDFQIYRRVFGLICIATGSEGADPEAHKREVLNSYNGCVSHYSSTVLETRCFVFTTPGATTDRRQSSLETPDSIDGANSSKPRSSLDTNGHGTPLLDPLRAGVHKSFSENNLSSQQLSVPVSSNGVKMSRTYVEIPFGDSVKSTLRSVMEDYLLILFSMLESKRPLSVPDKVDKDWKGSQNLLDTKSASIIKKESFTFDLGSGQKKRQLGQLRRVFGEWLTLAGLPYPAIISFAQAADMLANKEPQHLAAALEGWAAASFYVLPAADPQLALRITAADKPEHRIVLSKTKAASVNGYLVNAFNMHSSDQAKDRKHCLLSDAIFDKLRLAAETYSVADMSVLELEVSLKLARLFIFLNDRILAHRGLRQAIFVRLDLGNDELRERIDRFLTVADLYSKLDFKRQTGLFQLLAADRFMSVHGSMETVQRAYRLTAGALPVYKLHLSTHPKGKEGWPEVQAQVLLKLAATCRTNPDMYVRVLLIIIESFLEVLSSHEQDEILKAVDELIRVNGPPNGIIRTPDEVKLSVPTLTKIPPVLEIHFIPLPHYLQPHLKKSNVPPEVFGPFIHSALTRSNRKRSVREEEAPFMFVVNEPFMVQLQLRNTVTRELRVENLTFIGNGALFEAAKVTLVLPPMSGLSYPVMISGVPSEAGYLNVTGYSFLLWGIENTCHLGNILHLAKHTSPRRVKVVPELPQLKLESSLPPTDMLIDTPEPVVLTASAVLFAGQRSSCTVTMTNVGKVALESLSALTKPVTDSSELSQLVSRCVSFDSAALESQLPVSPGDSIRVTIDIWAGVGVSHSRANDKEERKALPDSLQFIFQLNYSGGPGQAANYYRVASVLFVVEFVESISVTRWSAMPGENADQYYLVLDVENHTDEEVEVIYAPSKKMLILGKESARIPSLMNKLPLSPKSVTSGKAPRYRELLDGYEIAWAFVEREEHGKCWLGDLTWSQEEAELIALAPLKVNALVCLEDELKRAAEHHFDVGIPYKLNIMLENQFEEYLEDLAVKLYVRAEDSGIDFLVISGRTESVVSLQPCEKFILPCQIVLLIPGVFHFSVSYQVSGSTHQVGPFSLTGVQE